VGYVKRIKDIIMAKNRMAKTEWQKQNGKNRMAKKGWYKLRTAKSTE